VEDIHEVSVGGIASKVADDDAVPDGVVDGAGLLSGGVIRIWRRIGRAREEQLVCSRLGGRFLD